MLPVQHGGQMYFTSQYFHQVYRQNCKDGGKYALLKNFNALIRSIEAYPLYVERDDIVELTREKAGLIPKPASDLIHHLEPLFKATFGKPVLLINATAQVALTHHLDDEISRRVSVSVNEQAATQATPFLPAIEAQTFFVREAAGILRLSETSKLRLLGNVAKNTGLPSNLLPAYSAEQLTRALGDLLKEHGSSLSAVRANPILQAMGYLEQLERRGSKGQTKKFWSVTETGQRYGKNETAPASPNETQPRWYVDRFGELLAEIDAYRPALRVVHAQPQEAAR
jgi:hypothetical protein